MRSLGAIEGGRFRAVALIVAIVAGTLAAAPVAAATDVAPANDSFAAAAAVTPDAVVTGTTYGATTESGELEATCGETERETVWYRYTSTGAGRASVTVDSKSNKAIAVYTGRSLSALTSIACAYDAPTASVEFSRKPNQTYWLKVSSPGYGWAEFKLLLDVSDPANDDVGNASLLVPGIDTQGDTRLATFSSDEPVCDGADGRSVWYRFTPSEDTAAFVTVAGRAERALAVYEATAQLATAVDCVDRSQPWWDDDDIEVAAVSAKAGRTYLVSVLDRSSASPGDFTIGLEYTNQPANDDRAAAVPLPWLAGAERGTTHGATFETGEPRRTCSGGWIHEPMHSGTVWYSLTAPQTGTVSVRVASDGLGISPRITVDDEVSLSASLHDAMMAVYQETPAGLVEVQCTGDDRALDDTAVGVRAGETYFLAVSSSEPEYAGPFSIATGEFSPAPPNDDLAGAVPVLDPGPGALLGTAAGATRQPGEPVSSCGGGGTVWYSFVAPARGTVHLYSSVDHPGEVGSIKFEAPTVALFKGSDVASLEEVSCVVGHPYLGSNVVGWVEPGETYSVAVSAKSWAHRLPAFAISSEFRPSSSNDQFADAVELAAPKTTASGSTRGATREPGEPRQSCQSESTGTVWYRFVAPADGAVEAVTDADGWGLDVAIFEGGALSSLEPVDCSSGSPTLRTLGPVSAGKTYAIAVSEAYDSTGDGRDFDLTLTFDRRPDNDDFIAASAVDLGGGSGEVVGDVRAATLEPREPAVPCPDWHSPDDTSGTVWYRFVAPATGAVRLHPRPGLELDDYVVSVYKGNSLDRLERVACEEPFGADTLEPVGVESGRTYFLSIATSYFRKAGPFAFDLLFRHPPANDDAMSAAVVDVGSSSSHPPVVVTGDITAATAETGEDTCVGSPPRAARRSAWYTAIAPEDGTIRVSVAAPEHVVFGVRDGATPTSRFIGCSGYGTYSSGQWRSSDIVEVRRGTTIAVDVSSYWRNSGSTFDVTFDFTPAPTNDALAGATVLEPATVVDGDNSGATVEDGERDLCNCFASLWYRFPAVQDGTAVARLTSDGPHRLRIFEGTSLEDLVPVGAAPMDPAAAAMAFPTTGGKSYFVAVSTVARADRGGFSFLFDWSPAAAGPVVSVSDASAAEGSLAEFTVSLSERPVAPVAVSYQTVDMTAHASRYDYTAASGLLTFAPGETSKTVRVQFAADNIDEDDERLGLMVTPVAGGRLGDGFGVGVIGDTNTARLRVFDVAVSEGSGKAWFWVATSAPSTRPITVTFSTVDGTATAGKAGDYQAVTTTIVLPPGAFGVLVGVSIHDDRRTEGRETFGVELSNPQNAELYDGAAVGTILDND